MYINIIMTTDLYNQVQKKKKNIYYNIYMKHNVCSILMDTPG